MSNDGIDSSANFSSDSDIIKVFDSLSHPIRLKIMGLLFENRYHVSELARMMNISRPLLYMHLQKLESAGLIKGIHEISHDGKAMKYYEVQNFKYVITPTQLFEYAKIIIEAEKRNE